MNEGVTQSLTTILLADVVRSTDGWQRHGDAFGKSLARLHEIARLATAEAGGVYSRGAGDGLYLLIPSPVNAVRCSLRIQTALLGDHWAADLPRLELRVGIHTDVIETIGVDHSGFAFSRAHRVMDAANGSQILLTEATHALVADKLKSLPGVSIAGLGIVRLRDLWAPERLFRVHCEGVPLSELPLRALPSSRHNLLEEDRLFVGREAEISQAAELILERRRRWVTITGMGGIGKTRLARQIAARLVESFPDGVWLVECDSLRNREELLSSICGVLNISIGGALSESVIAEDIGSRRMLLVLDCFEEMAEHANAIDLLLASTSDLHCLVTSRRLLGFKRESELPLRSMPTTPTQRSGRPDSVALFLDAASYSDPNFKPGALERRQIADICRRLDGNPLFIVLAAARLSHMSVGDILRQIESNRFRVIRDPTGKPGPHSDIRAIVGSQFELLSGEDTVLIRKLALFVGGFYEQDAEEVCGGPNSPDVVDGIARLRNHSLLETQTSGDRSRYRMLDTIREYLAITPIPELESDISECRARHSEHFAKYANSIAALVKTGRQVDAVRNLQLEIGNVRAAVAFAISRQNHERTLVFALALCRSYFEMGLWMDFELLADAAEAGSEITGEIGALAETLGLRGALARRQGNYAETMALWKRRFDICEQIGDPVGCADSLLDLCLEASEHGDTAAAKRFLARARKYAARQETAAVTAVVRAVEAQIACAQGGYERAKRRADETRRLLRAVSDLDTILYTSRLLGQVFQILGDQAAALNTFLQALNAAQEGERRYALGLTLLDLGTTYESLGHLHFASQSFEAAVQVHAELNSNMRKASVQRLREFQTAHPVSEGFNCNTTTDELSLQGLVDELLSADYRRAAAASPPPDQAVVHTRREDHGEQRFETHHG